MEILNALIMAIINPKYQERVLKFLVKEKKLYSLIKHSREKAKNKSKPKIEKNKVFKFNVKK